MQDELFQTRGMVVASKANYFEVEVESSNIHSISSQSFNPSDSFRFLCTKRNRLNHSGTLVNVGDNVILEYLDLTNFRAVIVDIESRENLLIKPPVANVTSIFVVLALKQPDFDLDQASRFLLAAEVNNLDVSLVLSKSDLVSPAQLHSQLIRFSRWGYNAIAISSKTGEGINNLRKSMLSSRISVLCGPSGVGKTSLLKCLLPSLNLRIGSLSKRLNRGRHTTRNVELYSISKGIYVADTPGFNRPEFKLNPYNLALLYPELRIQLEKNRCKFRNCLHRKEPGCVVNKDWERYEHYRKYLGEILSSLP